MIMSNVKLRNGADCGKIELPSFSPFTELFFCREVRDAPALIDAGT